MFTINASYLIVEAAANKISKDRIVELSQQSYIEDILKIE